MNAHHSDFPRIPNWRLVSLSVFVLLVCLFYTYAAAYLAPYPGFDWGPGWTVDAFEPCKAKTAWCETGQDSLQIGDQLLAIGDLTRAEYRRDGSSVPFGGYNPGDWVSITFRRAGEERTVDWQMLGPTNASRIRRLMLSLLVYAPFWLAGSLILIFLQPRDLRWRLLILFNYAIAIWLAVGAYSALRVAYASPVQHAFAWLLAPVYLHLHLTVPSPLLRRHRRYFLPPLYAITAILALLEFFQMLPRVAFNLSLLLAFLGSFGVVAFRLLARPPASDRPAIRLMLAGIGLALGPGIALAVIPVLLGASLPTGLVLSVVEFAIPLLPFFYIYAIYKRRLGPLEFRANRLLSLYSFILLYATAFILFFSIASQWLGLPDSSLVLSLAVSMVFVITALPLRARFQRLVDRLAYGTEHNPDDIVRAFASQIPAALNLEALGRLLADEVAPSLLIRQSALHLLADGDTSLIYARGVDVGETLETPRQIRQLLAGAGRYRPPVAEAQDGPDWVRLAISLETREKTMGVWLFGRRDPDDYYPQSDITLLTTLAGQVAVALENAQLYDQARQEIIERKRAEEALVEERASLARRVAERTAELSVANVELARAARLKDEFLAAMSHELRTPLNAVLGLSEMLHEGIYGPLNERQLESLRTIEKSGRHLLELINDILDVAKIGAGKLELKIGPVAVEPVCEASLGLVKQAAHKKRLRVAFTLDNTVEIIQADEHRLKQILANLLNNGVKFTPEGGTVGLEVEGDAEREVVHFTIWDTGVGIAPEEMDRLFEPFVQLDSSLSRRYEGTGLGLALVCYLTEMHGGGISVESEPGQGSRFTVSLPWQPAGDKETRRGDEGRVSPSPPLPGSLSPFAPLLLLAEDNESNANTISEYLLARGYRVVVARDGVETVARAREAHPDLILMDIQMPGMDGLEATRRIRADVDPSTGLGTSLAEVPIVALTALAMPGDRERCLEAGADEYLSKPVSLKGLVETIEAQLSACAKA